MRPAALLARVAPRVALAEHRAAGPGGRDDVQRQLVLVDDDRPLGDAQRRQHLVVDDELLRRVAVERREDAGGVQDVLRVHAQDRLHGQRRLDAGLGVGHVRVGDGAAGAHRDAQPVAEPHGRLHERPVLRRAHHQGAGLHGRERRGAAVDERGARARELREHEAGEQLGVLHGEQAGERDGRRRAAHGADGDQHGLAEARQAQQPAAPRPRRTAAARWC